MSREDSRPPRLFPPASITRIVVRSTNWIGDVVMLSPALRALRTGFPGARLDVVARRSIAGLFRGHPLVDDVVVEDGGLGAFRLAARLRRRRYDLAVLMPKSLRAAVAPALAGIPRRVGYPTDGRRFLLTHPVPLPAGADSMHHVEFFLGPPRHLGCPDDDRSLVFPVPEEDRREADRLLLAQGVRPGEGRLVAVHPGASRPERAWAAERFGEVAAGLVSSGARVVVLGAPRDAEAARAVLAAAGTSAIDAVGAGGIARMAALVARCDLFVGNDSGPMHVAAAMGTPTVSVFGPGVPWKTAPYVPQEQRREATRHFACAPCRQAFFRECDPAPSGRPWCLEALPPSQVLAAARELLDRK